MKKFIWYVVSLLYFGVAAISLLILVKPGAAFFFVKQNMDRQAIVKDAGFAFRYRLEVNKYLIRIEGVQVYENGQLLTLSNSNTVVTAGRSTYTVSTSPQGQTYIYFAASDNSDPLTNGKNYTLFLPLTFITRPVGLLLVVLLMPLLIRFFAFAFGQVDQRAKITGSPLGILQVVDSYFAQSLPAIPAEIHAMWHEKIQASFWMRLFAISIPVAYFYIFMEWLFQVTMPSFMSLTSIFNKLEIFLLSGLVLAVFCMLAVVVFLILDMLGKIAIDHGIASSLELIVPSVVLSCLVLLLVDNFTYTIFKFGIITSSGVVRGLYGLFFLALSGYLYFRTWRFFVSLGKPGKKAVVNGLFFSSLGIVIVSLGLAIVRLDYSNLSASNTNARLQGDTDQPNIILLGGDGLSADHLSLYGYSRGTTPRLNELAQTSLVAENAFSNASKTAGSIVSLLTGKLPIRTRVLYPPNILTGVNVYQHLPGILKNENYDTVELGTAYFVDAYAYNFQNAFDMVNGRTDAENSLSTMGRKLGYDNSVYFLNMLYSRIVDRILHILFVREMLDPYQTVTHQGLNISDQQKIDETLALIDNTKKPLFIHVHLLGTHGPTFGPSSNVFSKGEEQTSSWMDDFYDDAVLDFDRYVGEVIDHLKATGQFDNTILIIYTDHNFITHIPRRIPLMIHFPSDQFAGRLTSNVENIDIAPTILDYLGINIPEWMQGQSLIGGNLNSHRLIFSTMLSGEVLVEHNSNLLDLNRLKPPFYQFSYLEIIDCQKWYVLNLVDLLWESGDVSGYVSPCSENTLLSFDQIKQATIDQLTADGFDTSSLR